MAFSDSDSPKFCFNVVDFGRGTSDVVGLGTSVAVLVVTI